MRAVGVGDVLRVGLRLIKGSACTTAASRAALLRHIVETRLMIRHAGIGKWDIHYAVSEACAMGLAD